MLISAIDIQQLYVDSPPDQGPVDQALRTMWP